MRTNNSTVWLWIVTLTFAVTVTRGLCAVPDSPETWSGTNAAGWVNHDLVNEKIQNTLVAQNGALKLAFATQSMKMPPEEYVFEAGTNASVGAFTGDYVAKGITEIRFKLFCERRAEVSLLLWNSVTGRTWRYRIPNIRTGEWFSVSVPVDIPALRCLEGADELAQFEMDLRNVTAVGVAVEREQSLSAQTYWLDDFTLVGQNAEFAAWMEQFAKPPEYGAGYYSVLPAGDLDGDGIGNYSEWIAGTSAGDAADRFTLAIEQGSSNPRLRWKAAPGRRYQVWSTTDLNTPFTPLGPAMDATVPENLFEDPTTNGTMPVFYKLTVDKPAP